MSSDRLNNSDKKLMLKVMDYLIADVSSSSRWNVDDSSVPKTLLQLRTTRKLIEDQSGKVTSVYINNLFVAIEFYRETASVSENRKLSKIRRVFEGLPRFDEIRIAAELPDNQPSEFVILVDGSHDS